ncbi:MAG: alkaline phosphatase [Deltaproteobacteria bacterium]|nr:alkaline phosphatase [Deltaproteobacteria bacterium]
MCRKFTVWIAARTVVAALVGCRSEPKPPQVKEAVALPALPPATNRRAAPAPLAPLARHVIIISEDGLRPDALVKANGSVHGAVMEQGAYSLRARTIRHASTLPSHAAMLSGFDEPAHKLSWNAWKPDRGYIQVPTVFHAAALAGHGSAAFVGKQKLAHITPPGTVDVFARPGFFCKKVVAEAARYFAEKKPALQFVHFSDPDERGHAIGWMSDPQIEAIRHTDLCLATLVEAVHAAGLDDVTLFILSSDHGGHGRNHSGRTEEDRLIPWLTWGVGVRKGHRILSPISTMDTAATALWALGYPAPSEMQGRPVAEAFVDTGTVAP